LAACSLRPVADRQHRTRGLWRARHADRRPCSCHWPRPLCAGRHGRAPMPVLLGHRAVLAGLGVRRAEGHDGALAGVPGLWSKLLDPAIPYLQLHQSMDRRFGASLISMACLIGFLRIWQPKVIWTSPALRTHDDSAATMPPPEA